MEDLDSIRVTALNYIEGWYAADSSRMDDALHPKLVKRRFVSESEVWDVDKKWMVKATGEGRGKIVSPTQGKCEVTILDICGVIASVKVVSEKFVDYLHMIKQKNTWVIVDALWDYVNI